MHHLVYASIQPNATQFILTLLYLQNALPRQPTIIKRIAFLIEAFDHVPSIEYSLNWYTLRGGSLQVKRILMGIWKHLN